MSRARWWGGVGEGEAAGRKVKCGGKLRGPCAPLGHGCRTVDVPRALMARIGEVLVAGPGTGGHAGPPLREWCDWRASRRGEGGRTRRSAPTVLVRMAGGGAASDTGAMN